MTIPTGVAISLILAPAIVMVALIFFLRDMVQAKDLKERDMDRQVQAWYHSGAKTAIELMQIIRDNLNKK